MTLCWRNGKIAARSLGVAAGMLIRVVRTPDCTVFGDYSLFLALLVGLGLGVIERIVSLDHCGYAASALKFTLI